jgi:outer membrane protein assembly factor BamA
MKATRGEYRYTVPTLFNDTVEGSARLFGLRREEASFIRQEYGAGVEAGRDVPWIDARGTVGATYEVLRADDVELGRNSGELDNTAVSSITVGLRRDLRDNPIRPRKGQRWSASSETALSELGGDASFERVELAWSWHRPLGGVGEDHSGAERWLHAGVTQGIVAGGGDDVPVNKLFFPGGESSIRGYTEGEATQRDASGRFVGVRSSWLANLEFEQLVTGQWTAVLFADVLGTAREFADWPGDEILFTLGAGLRYQSPIGPLRIEYGRNLDRRDGDPVGTLHFSIGFPF